MRTQLKLLTLAIACALLYDGCKLNEPEMITTVTVELYDPKTQQLVPDAMVYIFADYGKGSFLYRKEELIDSVAIDAAGKCTKVLSSSKIGKPSIFSANIGVDAKFRKRYYGTQCPPFIDGCHYFDPGQTTTIVFYTY